MSERIRVDGRRRATCLARPGRLHAGTRRKSGIEELARERAASTIDLPLVEEGIEIGKKMLA
jgi:hypothetical protein